MIVWNFELYMLPISLLVIFLKNMFASTLAYNYGKEPEVDVSIYKPRSEKTGLQGFLPGLTQTWLYNHR